MKMFFLTPSGALALPANRSDSEFAGAGLARILLMLALLLSNWKAYAAIGVSSIAPTSAAEIKISSCGVDVTGTAKDYYNNTLPWGVAGTLNTAIDVATGIGHMPAAIGHLGEGTGTFSADPSWENAPGMLMDVSIAASVMAAGMSGLPSATRPIGAPTVNTPQGVAIQSRTPEAQAALQQVQGGSTVYRQGQLGLQNTGNAQYWSLQNPASTPNYANQMGMPSAAGGETWIMGGQVNPGSSVITRPAPAIPPNAGGAIEAVTQPGGVSINWFHMP